jgi:hypothetical protein
MRKESGTGREGSRKRPTTRGSLATVGNTAEGLSVSWVEYDRLDSLGHGVQFFHDELDGVVAFLEGFDWLHRPGSAATVRLLGNCPTPEFADRWPETVESIREAVLILLSGPSKLGWSFRRGPVHILVNG